MTTAPAPADYADSVPTPVKLPGSHGTAPGDSQPPASNMEAESNVAPCKPFESNATRFGGNDEATTGTSKNFPSRYGLFYPRLPCSQSSFNCSRSIADGHPEQAQESQFSQETWCRKMYMKLSM
jgi:hypothetical protein